MSRRRGPALLLGLLAGTALFVLGAADLKIPPSPDRWVTDTAAFLTPATAGELDRELEAFEASSGHQVLVYIGKTTDGAPIEDFATRAFQSWRVGRKGLDDGLALFIMADDKKIRIEVGYGLEPVVPDIIAGRVINDVMVPKIRAGDRDGAVRDGVAALLQAISGQAPAASPGEEERQQTTGAGLQRFHTLKTVGIIIAVVFFLILFITNPSLAMWLLFSIMSGGGGGRGGGGGGGFSGGGGRSGGGGASGGW